jgi:putative membrane protein
MPEDVMARFTEVLQQAGLCIVLVVMPAVSVAQADKKAEPAADKSSLTSGDKKFLKEAADGGLSEVELGKLAVEKASDENVRKFGQRMVDDHSKANEELKQLAASKGVDLPTVPGLKNRILRSHLSKKSGASFDQAYMADMVKDHKEDVAAFQRESNSAKDSDVKNFASKTMPTLKDHLKNAQEVAPKAAAAGTGTDDGGTPSTSGKPSAGKPSPGKLLSEVRKDGSSR